MCPLRLSLSWSTPRNAHPKVCVEALTGNGCPVESSASANGATLDGVAETDRQLTQRLEQVILDLLERRAATSSICPSDAARELYEGDDGGWRALLEPARRAAWRLVAAGEVEVTQAGRPVTETEARGPIRIRRASR